MSRMQQVNEMLQRALAETVEQQIELPGVMVTVTNVECSPDLKRAKVGVSIMPDKYYGTALKELRQKSGQIRSEMADKIRLKYTPRLVWEIDTAQKKVQEVEDILEDIKKEED